MCGVLTIALYLGIELVSCHWNNVHRCVHIIYEMLYAMLSLTTSFHPVSKR